MIENKNKGDVIIMLHSFTRNYNDLSTDAGFQFEFFCDCCGNGFKSTFVESKTAVHNYKLVEVLVF